VLGLKALPHDVIYVEADKLPSELTQAAGPSLTIPALLEREITLYEPRIIAEYLDERFPHPPLLPNDPIGRARMRLTGHRIELEWVAALESVRAGAPNAAKAKAQLRSSLSEADALFKAAKYFLSNDVGWCDCLILPMLWRLPRIGLPLRDLGTNIESYANRLFQTPLFQRTLTDTERALHA
jgi:RNA polymerase-associated protein